jgi:hypothetical protein
MARASSPPEKGVEPPAVAHGKTDPLLTRRGSAGQVSGADLLSELVELMGIEPMTS